MMRMAYVCADGGIPVFGDKGGSVHVRSMVRAFRALGHDVHVLCAEAGGGGADFPVEAIGPSFPPAVDRASKERRLLAIAQRIEERLLALHARRPFDMIYERYGLWSAAGVRAARRLGIPVVVEVNAPLVQEQAAFRAFVLRDAAAAIEAEVFGTATALAVVSQELVSYVTGKGAPAAQVHVIGNAVDTGLFHPQTAPEAIPGLPSGRFVVGFTGSLKSWHGTDNLVAAFAQLARRLPAHLLIVGDGPERPLLQDHMRRLGIEGQVTLTGWVPHHRLPGLIARMDVAVAPYPADAGHYFSPLKLFEYLAMGRPVVASRLGQTADLLGPSEAGLLVPPGDAPALAAALERVATDPDLAQSLARRAAAVGRQHDWQANAGRVIGLVQERALA